LAAALLLPASVLLSSSPALTEEKITIGVSLPQDDNPFYIAMLRGIRARAQELGWDVATVSSNEDKLKQINGVQDLVAKGVKGILISPIDAVGVNAAYDAAAQAKIPPARAAWAALRLLAAVAIGATMSSGARGARWRLLGRVRAILLITAIGPARRLVRRSNTSGIGGQAEASCAHSK
jgi:DNA-binding LacI/PurR family transcriptional regulator